MKNLVIEKVEKNLTVKIENIKTGRPVNPTSVRQLRLKELELKRQNGEIKKGRPIVEGSTRQLRLKELEAKKKLNGGKMPLGRPKSKVEELEVIAL
jgi:hypothetical protein